MWIPRSVLVKIFDDLMAKIPDATPPADAPAIASERKSEVLSWLERVAAKIDLSRRHGGGGVDSRPGGLFYKPSVSRGTIANRWSRLRNYIVH